MPKITILPHEELCPQGITFDAEPGVVLAKAMLAAGVKIPHACEFNCACATCHVIIREGYDSLSEPSDNELDHLDTAWGACAESRLSCQAKLGDEDVTVEIPRYNRNLVGERE
ncbi:ISC system 2Fe-2S type ferredoxin [Sutterella sp.]|uniref:ISC system 2Fe-2S type ferredoxin n=1 Tax=Sutterella sp. TaxID=1981025 RepID=UPI0026E09CB1|nr:ISC system 2Fe-2S type ferredoxin [Sutterella sp.]MDO5530515.1 ISC system 2Fe-2S type ferredoxin [Sutterella sp.]